MQNSFVLIIVISILLAYPSTSFTGWAQFRKISTTVYRDGEKGILCMSSDIQKKNYGPKNWKEKAVASTAKEILVKPLEKATTQIVEESQPTEVELVDEKIDIVVLSKLEESPPTSSSTSLSVSSSVELISSVVTTVKGTTVAVASIVSSVAAATVSFTKSADGEESRQAVVLAKDALGDAGKNVANAWSVVTSDWKNVTKGMEDVEASDEYLGTMSKALLTVIKNPEFKESLTTAVGNVRISLQEILTAAKIAVTGVAKEVKYSDSFKTALTDASENFKILFVLLKEIVAKTVLGRNGAEPGLPPSKQ